VFDFDPRAVDRRARTAQGLERVAMKRERLAVGESLDGGASPAAREERQLAERIPGPDHRKQDARPARRCHPHGKAAAHDQMERIGCVVVVEDDLAAAVGPALRDGLESPNVLRRDPCEQSPLHAPECRTRDTGGRPARGGPSCGCQTETEGAIP